MAHAANQQHVALEWDVVALGTRLLETGVSSIYSLRGLSSRQVLAELTQLREHLRQAGQELFVLDARGEAGPAGVERIVEAYLETALERGALDDETMRLAESLGSNVARGLDAAVPDATGRRLWLDTVGRLWTALSQRVPAVLLVCHPQDLEGCHRDAVEHLTRFVFSDPLAALAPEVESWERAHGALVFLGDCPFAIEAVHTLDYHQAAARYIRDVLTSDEVVRRFVDSTGGDIQRLTQLIDRLPENTSQLALFRCERLEAQEKRLLEVLAVAGDALQPDILHKAMALLGASEYFTRSLRALSGAGFIRRVMGGGEVRICVESVDLAEALAAAIAPSTRRTMHQALADAERVANEDAPDCEFLARHLLAAQLFEEALPFALRAARKLLADRREERARALLEQLEPHASSELFCEKSRVELHFLLADVYAALGEYRRALAHCGTLETLLGEDDARASLHVRIGVLLNRLSENRSALESFARALEISPSTRTATDARLGQAEAYYALGEHERLVEELEALVEELEGERDAVAPADRAFVERALLEARNTLGRVAIFGADYEGASTLFDQNRVLAGRWGWDDEVARAQANLGVVAMQRRDYGEALDRLNRALETSSTWPSLPRALCLGNLATVYQRQFQYTRALDHCLEALRCSERAVDRLAYRLAGFNLATIYQDLGAYEQATRIVEHLEEQLAATKSDAAARYQSLVVRANLALDRHENQDALRLLSEVIDGSEQRLIYRSEARLRVIETHIRLEQFAVARQLLDTLTESEFAQDPVLRSLRNLCEAELASISGEDHGRALELAHEASRTLRGAGQINDTVRARLVTARALVALERPAEARDLLDETLQLLLELSERVPKRLRCDFFAKPFHRQLVQAVQALDGEVPADVAVSTKDEVKEAMPGAADAEAYRTWRARYGDIIGEDSRLLHVFRVLDRVAPSDATVLVYGESGTGKELVAEALHRESKRTRKPFVKVNCAAFVENLLLSELFGHEKGAFTGAVDQKIGRFELADGGTLFLDEIGDISPNTQVALLRVLQEGTFERVGGSQTHTVDVRVVCATNKNLEELVRQGQFRLDLYYRLKGVVIEMPPLRERREDIGRLVHHFASRFSPDRPMRFSPGALNFLARYSWPGNIRELQNFVKSILLFVEGHEVELEHVEEFKEFFVSGEMDRSLPSIDFEALDPTPQIAIEAVSEPAGAASYVNAEEALVERTVAEGRSLSDLKKRIEYECIKRALIETGGNVTQAAEILQMKRPRLSQIINGDEELAQLKEQLVS